MAYEYDRFEREEGGGSGTFVMGVLVGAALGAGLGMLFAPKSGSELRSKLGSQIADQTGRLRKVADQTYNQASEQADKLTAKVSDQVDKISGKVGDKVDKIVERGREVYDRARTNASAV
jgi:gas vesicle protein